MSIEQPQVYRTCYNPDLDDARDAQAEAYQAEAAARDQLEAVQTVAEAVLHEATVDWGRKQVSVPWKAFFALADLLHVRPGLRREDDGPRPGPLGTNCGG